MMGLLTLAACAAGIKLATAGVSTLIDQYSGSGSKAPVQAINNQIPVPGAQNGTAAQNDLMVSGKCRNCRANLIGNRNTVVKCRYCDTEQVIR